MNMNLKFSTRL